MVTTDVEFELRQQLKEAGKQLSNPPASGDELLYILDQTEKLLSMVDQSPDNLMQEALKPPMKALVDDNLLKHLNIDIKTSVAICICEITRITAPEAPYTDEEMKSVFQLIVSSFEDLYDESSRSYGKRVAILETVCKVRSSVIMLDLECDELIVKMFDHFLKSVRDHHLDKVFSLMSNIMVLVIEESEEISVDLLKTLLASIKINDEGVLPVARKLAAEVITKSADKLGPYVKEILKLLNDSLDNYSQVLTAACEGSTDVVDHNDESVLVHKKADEIKLVPSSDDAAQVMSNGKMVTEKSDEAVDHISSVAEKSTAAETKPESVKEIKLTDNLVTDKKEIETEAVIVASDKKEQTGVVSESKGKTLVIKGFGSKKTSGQSQSQTPSTVDVLTKESEGITDSEMKSPKRARKMSLKAEENKASVTSGSDAEPKKTSELVSDSEIKSPKRGKKRTQKTVSGSDAEPVKKSSKKTAGADSLATGGLDAEPVKKSSKKKAGADSLATGGLDAEPVKKSSKKKAGADSLATGGSDSELLKKSTKKVETVDSESKPVKRSGKKKTGGAYSVAAGGSDAELVQKSTKKIETVDSESKLVKSVEKVGAKYSMVKKGNKLSSKKTEDGKKVDSEVKSDKKENETDSVDDKPLNNQSEKDDEETDSDNIPLKLSAKKGKKDSSSVVKKVKSSTKTIPKKNLGSAKKTEEKEQPKSESDDDGMDVPINTVLKKRKLSVGKPKVKESVKYDNSLVGKKVKVWWPKDKMYYEGVIESFDAAKKKHKVLYLDGEDENLNLRTQKWEIITEYSAPVKEAKTSASKKPKDSTKKSKKSKTNDDNKGEEKAVNLKEVEKSTEDEETKNSVEPKKIVYKSKGKNKTPKTEQKADVSEPKSACETTVDEEMKDADVAAEEEPESVKEKSTESPKIGET